MINMYNALKQLDFERLAGTEGEERARAILLPYIEETGLPFEVEPFDIYSYNTGSAEVEVDGRKIEAYPFGLATDASVEGELCFLENADVLTFNSGAYHDKIVLSYTASRRVADILAENKVKGYIGISGAHKGPATVSHRQKMYEEQVTPPSAMITYRDAERLIRKAGRRVTLRVKQQVEKRQAHNIVVTAGKPTRDNTLTYLVAHYDSVARSHGSIDNGGGTVCLLRAASYFAEHPPARELRIVFFSGEELGLCGSYAYTESHREEILNRGKVAVNIDLSGDVIGQDLFHVLGTKELLGYVSGIARENGLMFAERLGVYSSDCIPYGVYEVPSVSIARTGGSGTYFVHTPDDRIAYASARGLQNSYRAAIAVLDRILSAEIFPVRREIDESLRETLEKYYWQTRREKPALVWQEKYRK